MAKGSVLSLVVVGLFVLALGCAGGAESKKEAGPEPEAPITLCPMSGEEVDPATAPSVEHAGKTYYFCCEKCEGKFKANPDKYADE